MDRYIEALLKQIADTAPLAEDKMVSTIFFGGGTPSLMGANRLIKLFEHLTRYYRIKDDAEITIEVNPESATRELFEDLIPFGLNRVSLGAQSFQNEELERIGRVHNAETTRLAAQRARQSGIKNLSLDLIYALPGQTIDSWKYNVQAALECEPDHLSSYGLTYEEGTLLHTMLNKNRITPVLDETYVEMYDFLCENLFQNGFEHYEISNWCRPNRECRHNLIYWQRDEYLAFGVSAHGMFQGWRYSWTPEKDLFQEILESNRNWMPELIEDCVELDTDLAASDAMIFGLRLTKGVHLLKFSERFGYNPYDRWRSQIERLMTKNWLEKMDGYLRLTPNAYIISNEVYEAFLD